MNRKYQHILSFDTTARQRAVCVKTQKCACIYGSCWYLRRIDVGIYDSCWYLRFMLVFTFHAGIYTSCWYLQFMLVFTLRTGIYGTSMKCKYQHGS